MTGGGVTSLMAQMQATNGDSVAANDSAEGLIDDLAGKEGDETGESQTILRNPSESSLPIRMRS